MDGTRDGGDDSRRRQLGARLCELLRRDPRRGEIRRLTNLKQLVWLLTSLDPSLEQKQAICIRARQCGRAYLGEDRAGLLEAVALCWDLGLDSVPVLAVERSLADIDGFLDRHLDNLDNPPPPRELQLLEKRATVLELALDSLCDDTRSS
ncbi:MAG: hypothetical protein JW819_08050 [Candidatus Krumholzibacteriota bacterium]|nr:hypothetical protein [Candidatus Krumholzibacteriota bacterium]